jgi:hypothetical protein
MAKLPTAADVAGSVQPQRMRGVNVRRDAFMIPGMEQEGAKLQSKVSQFAIEQARLNSQTEAQDLANQLNTFGRNLESGNATGDDYDAEGNLAPDRGDFEPGYLNQYNRDALDQRQEYEKRFAEKRKELERTATSDAVRRMFRKTADAREASFLDKVGAHFNAQRKAYRKSVVETTVNESRESAIADPDDGNHAQDTFNAVFNYQRSIGMSVQVAKSLAEEARTKTHSQVIADLVKRDPFKAEKYFEDKRAAGEIDSDALAALREQIEGGVLRRKSQLATDEIFAVPNQSPADRLKTARSIKDDKLRDETVQRVKVRNLEEDAARKRDIRLQKEKMWKEIDAGRYKFFADIPLELRAGLDGTYLSTVEKFLVKREEATQGYGQTDDPDVLLEITNAEAAGGEEWANYDLNQHRDKLKRGTYNLIRNRQVKAINKDRDTMEKGPSYTLGNTLAKEALGEIGIKYGKTESKANNANANRLFDSVREFVDDYFKANNGRLPKREEIEKHVARETLKVDFYDSYTTADTFRFIARQGDEPFELEDIDEPETQKQIATATGFDQATVASIIAALQRANQRVTLANIEATYKAAVRAAKIANDPEL